VILSVTGIGGHDISFLEQMREDVGTIDTILVGPSEWGEGIHPNLSQVIDAAGAGADGTYTVLAQSPCLQDEVQDLFDRYLAECSLDSVLVYSAFQAWSEAFGISSTKEPDEISEVLRTHPINTVLGPLTFDQDGNASVQLKRMHIRRGGKFLPL
jgi:ABC-type branched-subunit amino acid transport system substrate-binding protein